jgi:hypothetical protein
VSSSTSDGAAAQDLGLERLTITAVRDHVSCDLDGTVLILHVRDGVCYGLDAIGTTVWKMIQTPITASIVRDTLVTEYEVDPRVCENDLRVLLQGLAERGLIEMKQHGESSSEAAPESASTEE